MKENDKDILAKAIEELKKEKIPTGPSEELLQATTAKLNEVAEQSTQRAYRKISFFDRLTTKAPLKLPIKVAAAAVLLVAAGYTIGRLTRPRAIDVDGLYYALEASLTASLESTIRDSVLEEMNRRLSAFSGAVASGYSQLRDELRDQYRRDLSDYAIRTIAASSAVTNRQLEELIHAINTAQTRDRQWVTTALHEIELNRLQDKTQLTNNLEILAYQTEEQLQRTEQHVAQLLANTEPDNPAPNAQETVYPQYQRKE
jgi:hypothetical protein